MLKKLMCCWNPNACCQNSASKWEYLLNTLIERLKLLRIKRLTQIKQLKDDIAKLTGKGHLQTCLKLVELLYKEQCILDGYDMIEPFCEYIIDHLHYILMYKDRAGGINEAISTLIYASARCTDLPELLELRYLFTKRYGSEFVSAAAELHPDSCIKQQIIDKLSMSVPTLEVKLKLIKEIAIDFNLGWDSNFEEAEIMNFQARTVKTSDTVKCEPLPIEAPLVFRVHPKLPNYENVAATFTALKEEYRRSSESNSRPLS